ncbi:isochorismatase [Candidatus Gracilibacteria bacterium]|nr:MAG: isochorismatase [Candidatus Gracilibacteria bacterium]
MKKALIIIDFINDIVSKDGKLAGKGYASFIEENNVIENTNKKIEEFRKNNDEVIFVKIQFKEDYSNQPKNSPLFGKAHEFGIFKKGESGDEFFPELDVKENDTIFIKTRVSAFYKTGLEEYLQEKGISELYFAGCATDLAIENAVRDAHDRDFSCFVLENCSGAGDRETHNNSLKNLGKIAKII